MSSVLHFFHSLLQLTLKICQHLVHFFFSRKRGVSNAQYIRSVCIRVGSTVFTFIVFYLLFLWITLPDISDPRSFLASQSTVVLDRNGVELYRFFQEEDRTFVDGEIIPQHLKHAIIAIEDERFYDRGCLDIRAIARAAFGLGRSGGASTLTRQLARNALQLKQENIYNRKLKELVLGCQMEGAYTKDELLNLYLNWIPFGQNAYGVEQASQLYFGVPVEELTLGQSAVLASLPQLPTYYNPYGSHRHTQVDDHITEKIINGTITKSSQISDDDVWIGLLGAYAGTGATTVYVGGRTDQVLKNMEDQELITESERLAALEELETITFQPSRENIRAPHFVLWVRKQVEELFAGTSDAGLLEQGGLTIETTLDWQLQEIAEGVVEKHRQDLLDRYGARNIALFALDAPTREIISYVGNADYSDQEFGGKIDMVHAPRQPGSSFKPFVYASAFEKGYSPATILFDVPTKIGDNEPQNFDGLFMGPMSIRRALGSSRNIPAAKAFFLGGGEDAILQLVSSMGAPTPLERRRELAQEREGGFDYGWPLALGAAETPLAEVVNAYATFADGGVFKDYISIRKIRDKHGNILYQAEEDTGGKQALDERIAYQITSVLSDKSVRPDEYWQSQLSIGPYQTAAKTGTSNKCLEWEEEEQICLLRKPDNAWLIGYTPNIVAGVWVGNADSSAMFDKAGGLNTASPIWHDYLASAHRKLINPTTEFPVPDGIVQPQVSRLSGELASECTPVHLRQADVFLKENAPKELDPACQQLTVDKVTGLLASEECPEDAQEDGSFFAGHSILPNRWPLWEEGVQEWMLEQMELWNATPDHSGSLLPLPQAPEEFCDPSLTPGRLIAPTVKIVSPKDGGIAAYPAFIADIDWNAGSEILEVKYLIDGKRAAVETEPPFSATIRVPRSVRQTGTHTLEVQLEDEYFNKAVDTISFRFGEDKNAPFVRFTEPRNRTFSAGDSVTMRVDADDDEGGIKYVQFYLNDVLLSTKPKAPYEMTYILDVPNGIHTLRAVAEDMARHRTETSLDIGVGQAAPAQPDVLLPEPENTVPSSQPAILTPSEDITLQKDEIIEFAVQVPFLGGEDIAELHLVVVSAIGEEDVILRLSDGEGLYRREWKGRNAGQYKLILTTKSQSGEELEWDKRIIEVQ